MCQVYFGKDKKSLVAMGLPLDIRQAANYRNVSGTHIPSSIGWELDTDDDDYNAEVDKKMRNNGFMKGPQHYSATPGSSTAMRTNEMKLRRIMVSEDMDPDKEYYIRFKNVLDDESLQFFMDYFEFVSKDVYDNPVEPEDVW
jgi:hypothetical protein